MYSRAIADAIEFYDVGYHKPDQLITFDLDDDSCAFRKADASVDDSFSPRIASASDLQNLSCSDVKQTLAMALVDTIHICERRSAITVNEWFGDSQNSMFSLLHAEHLTDSGYAVLADELWASVSEPNLDKRYGIQSELLKDLGVESAIAFSGFSNGSDYTFDAKGELVAQASSFAALMNSPQIAADSLSFLDLDERTTVASVRTPKSFPIASNGQINDAVILWDKTIEQVKYEAALNVAAERPAISMAELATGIQTGSITGGRYWVYSAGIDISRFIEENGIDVESLPTGLQASVLEMLEYTNQP